MPADPNRDLFGRLLIEPEKLPYPKRIDELRKLAAALQDGKIHDKRTAHWLGKAIQNSLQLGGPIEEWLHVRPQRGGRSPKRLLDQGEQDRTLLRLSVACGGDQKALAVLRGTAPCPPAALELLQQLDGAPKSRPAISRARKRVNTK